MDTTNHFTPCACAQGNKASEHNVASLHHIHTADSIKWWTVLILNRKRLEKQRTELLWVSVRYT